MQKIQSKIEYLLFENIDELDTNARNLMNEAIKAREKAYAPYSNFNVVSSF